MTTIYNRYWRLILRLMIVFCAIASFGSLQAHEGPVDRDGCHYGFDGRKHCH